MTRVLVVNHAHSIICGIHDIGKRIHDCLCYSTQLEIGYAECGSTDQYFDAYGAYDPDVVIVNYRADLMPWWPQAYGSGDAQEWAVLHQYEESTADVRASVLLPLFDHVIALDPLLQPKLERLHAVGRPVPETVSLNEDRNHYETWTPRIGSFGFAFPHKGFVDVAREIATLDQPAVYNLHMPEAYFNGAQGQRLYTDGILAPILGEISNHDVGLVHTAEHLAERELVNRLAMNDVNCLLYHPGQPDAGLSSALDYLIAARRPMLLSSADMFRHAWYGNPAEPLCGAAYWPIARLSDVLEEHERLQQLADALYAWHHGRLVADIERIVSEL
jgi:hypothetical protein